jgi:aerobic-type carbon monoxide dehydrogenase small subunit (CoxS/CutS family)
MKKAHPKPAGLWVRLSEKQREPLTFFLNGEPCRALIGDTIMTALLTQSQGLRRADPSGAVRAGFCVMGACQDCWVATEDGSRLRSCLTLIEPGLRLVVTP